MTSFASFTAITTRAPDRLAAFYRDAFGFVESPTSMSASTTDVRMMHGEHAVDFIVSETADTSWQDRRVCDQGFTHVALGVIDFDAALDRAVDAGYRPGTPYRSPEVCAVYGQDPEGNTIEMNSGGVPVPGAPLDPLVRGVVHVGVSSPDIRRLVSFYVDRLGFRMTLDRMDAPNKGRSTGLTDPT